MGELLGGFTAVMVLICFFLLLQILNKVTRLERQLIQPGELSDYVKEIARDPARKIMAIKAYREETGAGLADAKDAVEAYIRSQNQ